MWTNGPLNLMIPLFINHDNAMSNHSHTYIYTHTNKKDNNYIFDNDLIYGIDSRGKIIYTTPWPILTILFHGY